MNVDICRVKLDFIVSFRKKIVNSFQYVYLVIFYHFRFLVLLAHKLEQRVQLQQHQGELLEHATEMYLACHLEEISVHH